MKDFDRPFISANEALHWLAFRKAGRISLRTDNAEYKIMEQLSVSLDLSLRLVRIARSHPAWPCRGVEVAAAAIEEHQKRQREVASAAQSLIGAIASGQLHVWGRPDSYNDWPRKGHVPIPADIFVDERVTVTVRDRIQIGQAINGRIGQRDAFFEIRFRRDEVMTIWPHRSASMTTRTGTAGRPSSKGLCISEMQRLGAADHLAPTLARQAETLLNWLQEQHPDAPVPTIQSLKNSLRQEYSRLRNGGH